MKYQKCNDENANIKIINLHYHIRARKFLEVKRYYYKRLILFNEVINNMQSK